MRMILMNVNHKQVLKAGPLTSHSESRVGSDFVDTPYILGDRSADGTARARFRFRSFALDLINIGARQPAG